jgi:hypothetical protein
MRSTIYVAVWTQDGRPLKEDVAKSLEEAAQKAVNENKGLLMQVGRE